MCDINGQDCYKARVVPSISSINLSTGYTTGGQELIIEGYSLNGDSKVEVMVGDAPCTVTEINRNRIKCMTSPTSLPSDSIFVGSNGLYRALFNETAGANGDNYQDYLAGNGVEQEGVESILTGFEIAMNDNYWHSYDHIAGFYKAPVDGLYQFHMTGDDNSLLYMSPTTDPMNPDAKVELIKKGHHSAYRAYENAEDDVNADDFKDSMFTEWISLTGGQLYYMEAQLRQGWGEVHLTVGAEINPTVPIPDHPMQKKQKHSFSISQPEDAVKRDTTKIIVSNAATWSSQTNYTIAF